MMADLMRRELHDQNRGGAIARFFNHPITLLVMLAACVALIAYGFLRKKPTADELYAGAQPLMSSDKPADWERAWNEYLEPLNSRFPDNPHRQEAIDFRRRMQDWRDQDRALDSDQPHTEAERFYKLGLMHAAHGEPESAQRIWRDVVRAFAGENDRRWVDLAERGLKRLSTSPAYSPMESVESALAQARKLFGAGKTAEAQAIWQALEDLYRNDPKVLESIRRERKP
jgi:serine/threonine-protein kinase